MKSYLLTLTFCAFLISCDEPKPKKEETHQKGKDTNVKSKESNNPKPPHVPPSGGGGQGSAPEVESDNMIIKEDHDETISHTSTNYENILNNDIKSESNECYDEKIKETNITSSDAPSSTLVPNDSLIKSDFQHQLDISKNQLKKYLDLENNIYGIKDTVSPREFHMIENRFQLWDKDRLVGSWIENSPCSQNISSEKENQKEEIQITSQSIKQILEKSFSDYKEFWAYKYYHNNRILKDENLIGLLEAIVDTDEISIDDKIEILNLLIINNGLLQYLFPQERTYYSSGSHWHCVALFTTILIKDDYLLMGKVLELISQHQGDLSKLYTGFVPIHRDTDRIFEFGNLNILFARYGKSSNMARVLSNKTMSFFHHYEIGYYDGDDDWPKIHYFNKTGSDFIGYLKERKDLDESTKIRICTNFTINFNTEEEPEPTVFASDQNEDYSEMFELESNISEMVEID